MTIRTEEEREIAAGKQGKIVPVGEFIAHVIRPETELEQRIIADPEFEDGAMYGEPRPGHPEGKVVFHIAEVLLNVDKYSANYPLIIRDNMRLIALIHDTFKHKVDRKQSASGENHHAMIARRFAERYIYDTDVLDVIELHDEAYNAWCNGNRDNKWEKAEKRYERLIGRLGSNLMLYRLFYRCDNETGDKDQTNYNWFDEKSRTLPYYSIPASLII